MNYYLELTDDGLFIGLVKTSQLSRQARAGIQILRLTAVDYAILEAVLATDAELDLYKFSDLMTKVRIELGKLEAYVNQSLLAASHNRRVKK